MYLKTKITTLLLAPVFLQGCGSIGEFDLSRLTEKFTILFTDEIKAIEPPSNIALSDYKNIVIKSNVDNENTTISTIETELNSSKVGDELYFDSVNIYKTPNKLDSSYAIFTVTVEPPKIESLKVKENRIRCPGDGLIRSCSGSEGIQYTVDCTRTIATVYGSYLITNSTGKKITNNTFNSTSQDTACEDHMSTPESPKSLSYQASLKAGQALAKEFIPKVVERPNDLIDTDKTLSPDDQNKMEQAFDLASNDRIIEAKEIYKSLYKKHPQTSSLVYNLAYCEHMLGNYASAAESFGKYLSKESDPNSDAQKYLDEANIWISKGINKVIDRT